MFKLIIAKSLNRQDHNKISNHRNLNTVFFLWKTALERHSDATSLFDSSVFSHLVYNKSKFPRFCILLC